MAGFFDQIASVLPNVSLAQIGNFAFLAIVTVLVLIIVGSVVGIWMYFYINKKRFNKIIRIFEKVDGRYKPTISDRAMERKIGTGGDTVFYIQKLKKIVPIPSIQTGINTFWFAKREDGELINIGMEDIDLKLREAKVNYLDKETRYARASLQKLNKDRFNKETFWQKYGNAILSIVFIVVVSVMLLLITSKLVELIGKIGAVTESSSAVMNKAVEVMSKLDNICSQSGIVQT